MTFGIIFIGLFITTFANLADDIIWIEYKLRWRLVFFDFEKEALYKRTLLQMKRKVDKHNALYKQNKVTYKAALQEYSHLPFDEFVAKRTGFKQSPLPKKQLEYSLRASSCPATKDWHAEGYTTSVKNQGTCGSCYAFAAAAAIEGQAIRYIGMRQDLSPQQIVDCSRNYGNMGCEGGFPDKAFQYCIDNGGITGFSSYPYANAAGSCRAANPLVTIASHRRYVNNHPETIKQLLCDVGPVVVAIKVTPQMSNYAGGVYRDTSCGTTTPMNQLNHAVTLVGYGVINGIPCWKIKNSWGAQWGEGGYVWISQNYDCGVKNDIYVPNK